MHAAHGVRCHCGVTHYRCDDCSADCTAGAAGGPATTAVDGRTRCYRCSRIHDDILGAATPRSETEAAAIRAGCAYYLEADNRGDPGIRAAMRAIVERFDAVRGGRS